MDKEKEKKKEKGLVDKLTNVLVSSLNLIRENHPKINKLNDNEALFIIKNPKSYENLLSDIIKKFYCSEGFKVSLTCPSFIYAKKKKQSYVIRIYENNKKYKIHIMELVFSL